MKIEYGEKIIGKKPSGKSAIEITRHQDPIMDNILIVKWIGKNNELSWIIEKDLECWINYLRKEGYTDIKINEDDRSSKKNNKKNKKDGERK